MPIFLGALGAMLSRVIATRIGQWVVAALVFLGLQFAVNEFAVGPLLNWIKNLISGAPREIIDWLGYLNLDRYVTMLLSAYAAAAGVSAVKLRRKPTGGA